MPHCGLRHSCCNARAAVRRARALELLESVHRPRAGLEVVPPTTGPGVVTLRKAQEFAERALGPRAPLGELKAAAVVRVRVPENLLAPREWRPPLAWCQEVLRNPYAHHGGRLQLPERRPRTKGALGKFLRFAQGHNPWASCWWNHLKASARAMD